MLVYSGFYFVILRVLVFLLGPIGSRPYLFANNVFLFFLGGGVSSGIRLYRRNSVVFGEC